MWFTNIGRDALYAILNRFLAPYVVNLDMNQLEAGLWSGHFSVGGLRLKKGALDKFRLPIDVVDGHLGHLTLTIPWSNIMTKPAEVVIEDVFLVAIPASESKFDPEEDESRTQASKQERLKNTEVFQMRGQAELSAEEAQKNEGLVQSFVNKIVNNLQVTVKNIHIRYEDSMSVPGHPFAAGITLAGFTAVSVNDKWVPTFIQSNAGAIHKLAKLESLAVYFDTDSKSMVEASDKDTVEIFQSMISKDKQSTDHQFILKPVTGEGRITINHVLNKEVPRFNTQLFFDEIGFVLDDDQYRDAISMVDMYHFYLRHSEYRKLRPSDEELQENRRLALMRFAGRAILHEVHEKRRKWTWAYFAERRDDRKAYIDLFKRREIGAPPMTPEETEQFDDLERKLEYQDIRFYRSIARSQLKKERATRKKKEEEEKKKNPPAQGWLSWAWGASASSSTTSGSSDSQDPTQGMTDAQRKELYEAFDYDEKQAVAASFETPKDALKMRVSAKLNTGSFALRAAPHGPRPVEVISLVYSQLGAEVVQRPDSFEGVLTVGGLHVYDGTTEGSLYPQIVRVKGERWGRSQTSAAEQKGEIGAPEKSADPEKQESEEEGPESEPLLMVKYENNPLDERADNALTVKMKAMEIIYHRGYIEAIYNFLKPPESQLESVGALLNVASETLEGLRKETRAGLEYALQTHKTIDIKLDMAAPVIIIPENVRSKECLHLVLDAGHIAVESDLVPKSAIREIHAKRNRKYTDEDFAQLESLAYDKFFLKLDSAQLLIGNDLETCLSALTVEHEERELHLVERINIDFSVQNSISNVSTLPRFKVSGKLPTLKVNVSNTKYQGLMRMIDIAIPKLGDDEAAPGTGASTAASAAYAALPSALPTGFRLPSGLFAAKDEEGLILDDGQSIVTAESDHEDTTSEAGDYDTEGARLHQPFLQFSFFVDHLQASLFKSDGNGNGVERLLADLALEGFSLAYVMTKYDMRVVVNLRSITANMTGNGTDTTPLITSSGAQNRSDDSPSQDLVRLEYFRIQRNSPEYMTVHKGIDQSVEAEFSTFIFHAAPTPVLTLYDFIMTTFVPQQSPSATPPSEPASDSSGSPALSPGEPVNHQSQTSKIRVQVKLTSVQLLLIDGPAQIATLALSAANMDLMLSGNALKIIVQLGNLSLTDDSDVDIRNSDFKQILSIEGDNLADLTYETFDPNDKQNFPGYNSSVDLRSGSLRLNFLEHPLHEIYRFAIKFARMKGLYDAATQAAVQRASEIQRMKVNLLVRSPIVVFPLSPLDSHDVLTMKLGEISMENSFEGSVDRIKASLSGIRLTSTMHYGEETCKLKIIDDINIGAEVAQRSADEQVPSEEADTDVKVSMSDVKMSLTERQYCALLALLQSIPRVLANAPDAEQEAEESMPVASPGDPKALPDPVSKGIVDLRPELGAIAHTPSNRDLAVRTSMKLALSIAAIKLTLYDSTATSEENLKQSGIARLALNDTSLHFKTLSDGSMEASVVLKSFTVVNTRTGDTKFRDIIPAQHNRNQQVLILYTSSGGSGLAVVTIDSPTMIFSAEPVFALLRFFSSAFTNDTPPQTEETQDAPPVQSSPSEAQLGFRVDLHNVSISVLENDCESDTQAIHMKIKKIQMSQQGIVALTIQQIGMSLGRMGAASDEARFLDNLDLTLSLDSRQSNAHQVQSIELEVQPIVFRASYRDIMLITAIFDRAYELYSMHNSQPAPSPESKSRASSLRRPPTDKIDITNFAESSRPSVASGSKRRRPENTNVILSKEHLKARFEGFRLVLIGDTHEIPLLHLKTQPFTIAAKDWSGELEASAALGLAVNYWNLTNSHWEPLLEPWTFTLRVLKGDHSGGLTTTVESQERLDLNITATSIELGLATLKLWNKESARVLKKGRGGDAPYRIHNLTGGSIYVWSHQQGNDAGEPQSVELTNEQDTEWRIDNWRAAREHVGAAQNNTISVGFQGKRWEPLRNIPVDREGELVYTLQPRTEKVSDRLLCEVKVKDNVKVITLRSTYKVENHTLYPLEVMLVDDNNRPFGSLQKLAPGQSFSLPIEAVLKNRFKIRPDAGFGYQWSSESVSWQNLVKTPAQVISCRHLQSPTEAPFRFQTWASFDINDEVMRKYPKITLSLRAPIELENLLPHNLNYRIFDQNTSQNWRSYLRQGGIMPVHSVQLDHMVLLNIDMQESGFKPSEFAIINTDNPADFSIENQLGLTALDGRKTHARLNYFHYPNSGGAIKVQIYSPYVLINKTNLPFAIRASRSKTIVGQSNQASQTAPYMFSHTSPKGSEFSITVGESTWSKALDFEAPAAETELVLNSTTRNEEIHVGLSWTPGLGKYKLSKVVTLAPRFIIKNNLLEALYFRQHGVPPTNRSSVDPGGKVPIHTLRPAPEKLLTVAYMGLNAKWSPPINVREIGSSYFRMYQPGEQQGDAHLLRADVAMEGATIFVILSREEGSWPFKIDNRSSYKVAFSQSDETHSEGPGREVPLYELNPNSSVDYAWDYPAARERKIKLVIGDSVRYIDILEIGNLPPFRFRSSSGVRIVSLDVGAQGSSQTLTISHYREERSMYKLKRRNTGSLSRQDSTISSSDAFEAVTDEAIVTMSINLDLRGIGVSILNKRMSEVVYLSCTGLQLYYTDSSAANSITLTCESIQIDNQLNDAQFPIILQPTPIPKQSNGVESPPAIQASTIILKDKTHGVLFVKYASILMQAMTIQLDEDFLFAMLDMSKLNGVSWEGDSSDMLTEHPNDIPEPSGNQGGQDLYFEVLELQPIRLLLSFMRTDRVNTEEKLSVRNPLAVVLNALTVTLGNVNNAPLQFNSLAIKDARTTAPDLQNRIMYHYKQEVLRQLYRVLGSVDFIGNPVGLFTNVSSGVADIFYEPYKGVVMHGNRELGIGIAKGAASFVKKTVFGVTDSMTKFTGSIGKGLSAATFDSEYQRQRRLAQKQNKPRHALYGVTAGAEAFATSVTSGLEGVVMKPIEGAETEGAFGFFKGVGKGLVGAVTKPVVGIFDLASNVTEGIRNTTTVFDGPQRDRVRLPRHVGSEGILTAYSPREARGQSWVRELEQGRYRHEYYVAHLDLKGSDYILLLTNAHVLTFWSSKLRLDWEIPLTRLKGASVEDNGILFLDKAGRESDQFVQIPQRDSKMWFFKEIEQVVNAHNARRRIG